MECRPRRPATSTLLAGHRGRRRRRTSRTPTPRRLARPWRPRRRTGRTRSPAWSSAIACSACSSTPRSRRTTGLAMLRNFLSRVAARVAIRGRRPAAPSTSSASRSSSLEAHHRLPRRARRRGRQGRQVRGAAARRRSGGARRRATTSKGIDEVVILDVTATLESRRALARTISRRRQAAVHPARGRRRHSHRRRRGGGRGRGRRQGQPEHRGARRSRSDHAGWPCATAARRSSSRSTRSGRATGLPCTRAAASQDAARDAVEWAREAAERGAGEILLTSIDRDGTRSGFDCELTAAVSCAVSIPVIASGGAGALRSLRRRLHRGRADAALAASIFHFSEHAVSELKAHLSRQASRCGRCNADPGIHSGCSRVSAFRWTPGPADAGHYVNPFKPIDMFIPAIDLKDGQVVQLVQGKTARAGDATMCSRGCAKFERLSAGAADRPRRRARDRRRTTRWCGRSATPSPAASAAASAPWSAPQAVLAARAPRTSSSARRCFGTAARPRLRAASSPTRSASTRVIAAVDSVGGKVVIRGWTEVDRDLRRRAASKRSSPFCGEFLYTHVDTEGLMRGIDMAAVERRARRRPTRRSPRRAASRRREEVAGARRDRASTRSSAWPSTPARCRWTIPRCSPG